MKNQVCKNEICEGSLWTNLGELALVGRVDLKSEAGCK